MGVKPIEDVNSSEIKILMDPNAIEKGSEASQAILIIVQKYHNSRFCERNRLLEKENCVKMFKFGKHCRPWQADEVSQWCQC
jgi:hypothetical protein